MPESYHTKKNEYDPEQLRREGRDYWRDTLTGIGDAEQRVKVFLARYAGAYELQSFSRGGRSKTRLAYNALGGRKRQSPDDACGRFGRFVVAVGLEFQTSAVDFRELPELAPFRDVPEGQFDQEITQIGQRAIERLLGPSVPYVLVFECGEQGKNHMHVAHPVGSLSVGRKTLNTTPEDALKTARYFLKGPKWSADNLTAYVNAVRLQGRAAKRLRYGRLGSHSVTCADVGQVLGYSILRPAASSERNPVSAVLLFANREKRGESNLYGIEKVLCGTWVLPFQPDMQRHAVIQHPGLSPPACLLLT